MIYANQRARRRYLVLLPLLLLCGLMLSACGGQSPAEEPAPVDQAPSPPTVNTQMPAGEPPVEEEDAAEQDHQEIRTLLEKSEEIAYLSYKGVFSSNSHTFTYEYYRRDNLTKIITWEDNIQSVSINDGKTTVYYSLPEKTGYRMTEAGDDMGLVPNVQALLNEDIYIFRTVGNESVNGLTCRVVETEDEFGVLKIWLSKTLGLPLKYIGTDDGGWYTLSLSDIQTGIPDENIFAVPSDIILLN